MSKRPHELTPAQLAVADERKRKRADQRKARTETLFDPHRGRIVERNWVSLPRAKGDTSERRHVRIKTWNLLAQCLIRRELFPTSDCLKAAQREHMTYNELVYGDPDILCLQEVDRLEKILPVLEKAGYAHHYAAGPGKKHGCLIAFKSDMYSLRDHKLLLLDEQDVREQNSESARKGRSFTTKNIANLVGLTRTGRGDRQGLIIATTHLFWHPSYTYERARQVVVLKREVLAFRAALKADSWPCILSGDFNFSPDDPAYSLLVGDAVLPAQEARLEASRVVHVSVDPSVPITSSQAIPEDDEGAATAEKDPDKIIVNARVAVSGDGLLSTPELAKFAGGAPVRSAYDEAQRQQATINPSFIVTCGSRYGLEGRKGFYEPQWTSYTHYWKTVLDYIMVIDGEQSCTVTGYLQSPSTDSLEPGLPKLGVCASDHISLMAELSWPDA
ncbi:Endonuclease/exonuclease/phosphatase [Punctularia strigosozonata HHB-11173 SS5]|uniref:Endonuclease/exonuclease/phosphatase n=1 Tax=Punctularia strigosozonata (strain HHB-11173) TaxID=741275 RepID=UPI00044173B6|nr:Endonuclease/exonuclease/phosphatase [Punctularia strigosozonata HHB-11173 SS5]EIN14201.1 Endonuclease/exonuclease/phosphatase [Punctularia strigosozonata HHB-11173 SS5]